MDCDLVYDLLLRVRENDEEAEKELYEHFYRYIRIKARVLLRKYNNIPVEQSDLIQEGEIAVAEAVYCYKEIFNTKFTTFAYTCIDNRMATALRRANRKKHVVLNNALSIDYHEYGESPIISFLKDEKEKCPYEQLTDQEAYDALKQSIEENLSKFERIVFRYKIDGYNYLEIAEILEKDPKSIDNALQRIRKKVSAIF